MNAVTHPLAAPMYDHAGQWQADRAATLAAVERVMASGNPSWGTEVPAFEAEFAAATESRFAVATASGTASLTIALRALGLGLTDEVITAANSDVGTINAILLAGARPVLADVEPGYLTIDPADVARRITPRTRVLLPVDLFGQPSPLPELLGLAQRHGLAVVEDACLALGARIGERQLGSLATITCFSFAPTKHLGALGAAGACTTEDEALARRMIRIAGYGQDRDRHVARLGSPSADAQHLDIGLNARMDEVQAAILRARLPSIGAGLATRQAHADRYDQALAGSQVAPPPRRPGTTHAFRNYVVEVPERARVAAGLAAERVASAVLYVPPLHLQPAYASLGHRLGDFPVVEAAAERILGLPIGPHLARAQVDHAAEALRRLLP